MTGAASSDDSHDGLLGARLGHFRVVARIGRGGMGVVYRGYDEKLRRQVALKVLAPELMQHEERRQRFVREARSAAAVSHPHIAAIYEIGEEQGTVFIAMELVEGRTLRELIEAEGPLRTERATLIARDVARALARAHEAGVVHRDLKPDNVMIDADGEVKLLDFGLAKLLAPEHEAQGDDEIAVQDTVSHVNSTRDGRILGTPAYMSPEQGTGDKVDHRADIFSFGIMLYEMLCGRRPFSGATPMALIVSLSRDDPPRLSDLAPGVPPALEGIVHRCLEKSPGARYQSARELVRDLRRAAQEAGHASSDSLLDSGLRHADEPAGTSGLLLAALVLLILGAGLWAVAVHFSGAAGSRCALDAGTPAVAAPPVVLRERRLTTLPPEDRVVSAVVRGDQLFYQDQGGLWSRPVSGGSPRAIPLPAGRIADLDDVFPGGDRLLLGPHELLGTLVILDLGTGHARELRANALVGRVSPDGRQVAFVDRRGVHVIDLAGNTDQLLSSRASGDSIGSLTWSPAGARVAFIRIRASEDGSNAAIETVSVDGTHLERVLSSRRLMQPGTAMAWPEPDRLVYALASPIGEEAHAELWELHLPAGAAGVASSRRIHRFTASRVSALHAIDGGFSLLETSVQSDVYVAALAGDGASSEPRRLTLDDRNDRPSGWLGDRMLFSSDRAGSWDVYSQAVGDLAATQLAGGEAWMTWPRPAGAGAVLFFQLDIDDEGNAAGSRLMRVTPGAGAPPVPVLDVPVERAVNARGRPPPRAADYRCTVGEPPRCVLARSVGGDLRFATFGLDGRLDEPFARMERPQSRYEWDLSPDGRTLALVQMGNEVTLIGVSGAGGSGGEVSRLILDAEGKLTYVCWAYDGQGHEYTPQDMAGHRHALVHADLAGRSTVLLHSEHAWLGQPTSSPDGRALAYAYQEYDSDVYILSAAPRSAP